MNIDKILLLQGIGIGKFSPLSEAADIYLKDFRGHESLFLLRSQILIGGPGKISPKQHQNIEFWKKSSILLR